MERAYLTIHEAAPDLVFDLECDGAQVGSWRSPKHAEMLRLVESINARRRLGESDHRRLLQNAALVPGPLVSVLQDFASKAGDGAALIAVTVLGDILAGIPWASVFSAASSSEPDALVVQALQTKSPSPGRLDRRLFAAGWGSINGIHLPGVAREISELERQFRADLDTRVLLDSTLKSLRGELSAKSSPLCTCRRPACCRTDRRSPCPWRPHRSKSPSALSTSVSSNNCWLPAARS